MNKARIASRSTPRRDLAPGWIYRDLGVEPLINCAGVRTNYGGSNPTPEVLAAMEAAAEAFVDLDELAEGIGRRMASLTGAEWGIVTAGTAAGLALATAACLAGNDPERMMRLPATDGFPNRVLIPRGDRFPYDHAIRMAGAQIVTAGEEDEVAELLAEGSVAMICLLGRNDPRSTLPLEKIATLARTHGIPILVDAAGLLPANPDLWLSRGADLVLYSGGKYLRGPQSTGLLLGNSPLCRAAWLNGPPHQAFGRAFKIGKEEMVGALVALETSLRGSAVVEQARWQARLRIIERAFVDMPAITTKIVASSQSVTADRLRIAWDPNVVPIDAETLRQSLLGERPRILIHDFWCTENSIVVDPINLTSDEADVAGKAIARILSDARTEPSPQLEAHPMDVTGTWALDISFLRSKSRHRLTLEQNGQILTGRHETPTSSGAVEGVVRGSVLSCIACHPGEPMAIFYSFKGSINSDDTAQGFAYLGAAAPEHIGPVFRRQLGDATWLGKRSKTTM